MGKIEKLNKIVNANNIYKAVNLFKNYGFSEGMDIFAKKLCNVFNYSLKPQSKVYKEWFLKNSPSKEELKDQTKTKFKYSPIISIIVPTYNTPIRYLNDMIASVVNQSYSNWELCIADGSENYIVQDYIKKNYSKEKRIKFTKLSSNEGISNNTNEAIKLAKGDYLAFLDHDDIIAPNALFEVVLCLQETKHDLIYTDEDFVSDNLMKHKNPFFKPDWSPFLLRSHNYITHFLIVNKKLTEKVGFFNKEFDGAQDYDFVLRCTENAKSIHHIPKVLYHWRMAKTSVAANSNNKIYAYDAGKKAVQDHLNRLDISSDVESLDFPGCYHVHYNVNKQPLVSIIIPNKDQLFYLDNCINSIFKLSTYKNYEIIIVENNSEDKATFEFYKNIQKEYNNIKVVKYKGKFNYSAINNYGVQHSKGEYLLFLNNDTKLIEPDSIKEMLGLCSQDNVGCVGSKLLYDDNTLQHAGVVVGFAGSAVHPFHAQPETSLFYRNRPHIICDYSAVTAACLMTSKKVFNEVKGFTESFEVALNDVDYCLKLRDKRYSVVFNPKSLWYHFESKSRGYENNPEKQSRFKKESENLKASWPDYFQTGDKFYNTNFSLNYIPFKLNPITKTIDYHIDSARVIENNKEQFAEIRGWAISSVLNDLKFNVKINNKTVKYNLTLKDRPDVADQNTYNRYKNLGFIVTIPIDNYKKISLFISDEITNEVINFTKKRLNSNRSFLNTDRKYEMWYKNHKPSKSTLNEQASTKLIYKPKFSIIVPLYKTNRKFLKALINSVKNQSYQNWELCLSNGSGNDIKLEKYVNRLAKHNNKIKTTSSSEPLDISQNTNEGLKLATGDFVVFMDHDDLLSLDALFECASAINSNSSIDMIYSDEDKIDYKNKVHYMPYFKPDFNLDMLRSNNYICHLLVIKKSLCEDVGYFDSSLNGSQDFDYILRCVEKCNCIFHIPKILYHWRAHKDSTALDSDNKIYTYKAGIKALENHYKRLKINADVSLDSNNHYQTVYEIKGNPKVSIIIPNKDNISDLSNCIDSIISNNYKNFEIIIVENNSENKSTFEYYKSLTAKFENVNVVHYKNKGFNYSKINNFGVHHSEGDYLLLLNNDTELIDKNSIYSMLSYCARDDVGGVGAKLYYPDGTIQHAGLVLGIQGVAGHAFVNARHNFTGYFGRAQFAHDCSAVTAACFMIKRNIFESVKGFDESFQVAFNDVDLCLKIRNAGFLIIMDPYAEFYHYESKSRGYEDTPEKYKRFASEVNRFKEKWHDVLNQGDPYYNINLSLESNDFELIS